MAELRPNKGIGAKIRSVFDTDTFKLEKPEMVEKPPKCNIRTKVGIVFLLKRISSFNIGIFDFQEIRPELE